MFKSGCYSYFAFETLCRNAEGLFFVEERKNFAESVKILKTANQKNVLSYFMPVLMHGYSFLNIYSLDAVRSGV